MLSHAFFAGASSAADGWNWLSRVLPDLPAVIFVVSLLLLWRLWRFTLSPRYYPDDPKELPYWIPSTPRCVRSDLDHLFAVELTSTGHGIAFFNNSNSLLSRAKKHFNNTQDPYALTIANSLTYVITKPQDVAEAYRNTRTLSFNEFVQAIMRGCGTSEFCVQAMYKPLPKEKDGFPNPHGKPLGTLARQMHINQLYPGNNLDFLERQFLEYVEPRLTAQGLRERPYATVPPDSQGGIVLPLMEWSSDFFARAGQRAYFGPQLEELDPGLPQTFIHFDELSWQILYQYPNFLAGEMKSSRDKIQHELKRYFQIPPEKRHGDAWFTKAMENEMRALGIGEDDVATMMVTIYWGINTNTRKAAFWLLTYILNYGPHYINIIRDETAAAFTANSNSSINLTHLHEKCPTLDAMWNETIRLAAYSASVRFLVADTQIGSKILRKGNRLMIPYRQLHFDESIFGTEYPVTEFRPERFMTKTGRCLTRSDNWRPFGGGSTMCPGRHVAKRFVMLFVALLVRRFDVELLDTARGVPEADEGKPVLGLMSVKDGADVLVRVKERVVQ